MTIWQLIPRELFHRKVNTLLALVAVVVAVACFVGSITLLRAHDLMTNRIIAAKQAATSHRMAKLEEETKKRTKELTDAYRKIVLTLGFNVFVLPEQVSHDQLHEAGLGGHDMPENYVEKLGEAGVITINHLLPSLTASVLWPEQKQQVILTGVRGEVAIAGRKRKAPLIQPVEPGQIVLGYKVATATGLEVGDRAELMGEKLEVSRIHEARGTRDDNTVWIDLELAQKLLGKEGRITAIEAINCLAPNCHPDVSGIPSVTEEITKALPDTQVIIDMQKAKTRIDARERAAEEAVAAVTQASEQARIEIEDEAAHRAQMRSQLNRYAGVLNPLLIIAAGLLLGLLAMINVRERRGEIGILRALGVGSPSILTLFLAKALLLGAIGAVAGYLIGWGIPTIFTPIAAAELFQPLIIVTVLIATPLLAALASWIPALLAASEDPAAVLSEE